MGRKGLFIVVGSLNHITYSDDGEQNGGGCEGEVTLYVMGHTVKCVIEHIEEKYNKERGNTTEYISISSINKVDYTTI
jgi:hypothetical protein